MAASETLKPGRFRPDTLQLVTNAGTVDLQNFAGQLTILENVFTNCIFGELALGDARNLIEEYQIRGTEKVIVGMQSVLTDGSNQCAPLNFTFIVTGVVDRVVKEDRESMYVLKLVSPEGYENSSRVATKRFKGDPKGVLNQVYNEFVEAGSGGLDFFGLEFKRTEFVFNANYWSGYRCMNYALKQLAPKGSPEYMPNTLLFQSDKKNYCTSLSKMAHVYQSSRTVYDSFDLVPNLTEEAGNNREPGYSYIHPFIDAKYNVMDGVANPIFTDIFHDLNTGYMGSFTTGFDMFKRMHYQMMFDYTPNQAGIKGLPPVAGHPNTLPYKYDSFFHIKHQGGINPINEKIKFHPYSNVNMKAGNHNLWTDSEYGLDRFHFENTAFRDSAIAELTRNQIDIKVNGRTDVDLGMLVFLRFPNPKNKGENPSQSDVYDEKSSGLYQITGIRHDFYFGDAFEHEMKLEVVRDSTEKK
tara:strand:- start:537 stop:1943 length:1407 start_codon:yes stop_codon:yes gene_type:complete